MYSLLRYSMEGKATVTPLQSRSVALLPTTEILPKSEEGATAVECQRKDLENRFVLPL